MAVQDGQNVSAAVTNAAFLDKNQDTETQFKLGLNRTGSGNQIEDAQQAINDNSDAIQAVDDKFDPSTGHDHDGTNSKRINASNLDGHNPFSAEYQAKDITSVSGTTFDVSTDFTGETSGGDDTTEGIITDSPDNKVSIIETISGQEIEDATGKRVFGRLTEAASVWTLSFFVNDGGVETAHDLQPATDISIFYREVFGPANPRPTVPADVGSFDSLNVTADIVDASATTSGKVNTSTQSFAGQKTFVTGADVNGDQVVTESASQVITNKDIDGGAASNTNRLTVPSNATAVLDGLTRKAATIFFDTDEGQFKGDNGSEIIPLGGGSGGGSLDFFYQETFDSLDISEILVTGTWTKAFELSPSSLSGDQSVLMTQVSGSLGAYVTVATETLEENIKGNTVGYQSRYKYGAGGFNNDIEFRLYDVTNSQYIGSQSLKATDTTSTVGFITNVASNTAQVEWRFVVVNETIGAELRFDNVEGRLNPLATTNLNSLTGAARFDGHVGFSPTNTVIPVFANERSNTIPSELGVVDNNASLGWSFTANKTCIVNITGRLRSGASGDVFGLSLNSTQLSTNIASINEADVVGFSFVEFANRSGTCSANIEMESGDVVRVHGGANITTTNEETGVTINVTESAKNIIFENQSTAFDWKPYTPTFGAGFGTPANVSFFYRQQGDSIQITGSMECGTPSASIASISLPQGLEIDTSKLSRNNTTAAVGSLVGQYGENLSGDARDGFIVTAPATSTSDFYLTLLQASSGQHLVPTVVSNITLAGTELSFNLQVPVAGQSANDILYSVPVTNEVENIFSAKIDTSSGSPVITEQTGGAWIAGFTDLGTGYTRLTFTSGFFTESPHMWGNMDIDVGVQARQLQIDMDSVSATSADVVLIDNTGGTQRDGQAIIFARRKGSDYRAPKGYFLGNLSQPVAYMKEVQSAGVNGQAGANAIAGSYVTRILNDIKDSSGIISAFSSNQFRPVKGRYKIEAIVTGNFVDTFKAKLVDDTLTQDILFSTTGYSGAVTVGKNTYCSIDGEFIANGSNFFEVQQIVETSNSFGNGYGFASSGFGSDPEIYTTIKLTRVGD